MDIGLETSEIAFKTAQAALQARLTPAWAALLTQAAESEVLPSLLSPPPLLGQPNRADIAAFLALVIEDDTERLSAIADRVIVQSGGRDALLSGLLLPAAQMLGEMWVRDECDFMTVTLGVFRMDQIMKETASSACALHGCDNRVLVMPVPGEQHRFGADMVADAFREDGWCVRSGPAIARSRLLYLVRGEWFDVIGLSISSDRWLRGLPACIRALRRASCNRNVFLMIGGYAVSHDVERARFLGADAMAVTAREALVLANNFMAATVTDGLHRSMTRLVDVG
ncbi:MAG: cobalamin B12-binding domain-containing protein [Acidocella sp.]|nr:cobalamin B12-binding domain-containing protein [Acidocella sp.]